ncbi:MarR family transcriptional regulator [Virgibacillus phasianinus]|uniref:MarR family transcriptional regulator n=1 Tax=Virgibacillus phasianinus TaxID=2017483 RepID=A0A220TZT4_9BACI|nr:MarR family transcriptional regulator [Virgibacillus phasianinus]ASK61265.1 MarR family transcriptional regulator [Virgibacillus phasianinus]
MDKENSSFSIKKEDPSLRLFVVLSKTYRAMMDEVAIDMRSNGLTLTDFAVLELLYHRGEQPLQKIGEKILLTSGSITYVINKLERKEFLYRKPCPTDGRVTYAYISVKGTALLDEIFPDHWRKIEDTLKGLSKAEKIKAINLLKKLGTAIG